jgi:hypothetical protein
MKKTKKPNIEEEKLGMNPFLLNLKIPVNKIVLEGQYKVDKEGLILPLELELERDSSCRVYVDSVRRKQMVGLSPRGKDLLLWLIYEAENGRDWLWLNYRRYMDECNIKTYNTYKTAVNDVIINGFIQATVIQHVYWINPHFFFNGARATRFPKNVVRK